MVAASDSYVRDMEINALLSQLLVLLMEDSWNPENDAVKGKRVHVVSVREYIDSNYALGHHFGRTGGTVFYQ